MKIQVYNCFWFGKVAGVTVPRLKIIEVSEEDGKKAIDSGIFFKVSDDSVADISLKKEKQLKNGTAAKTAESNEPVLDLPKPPPPKLKK